MPPETQGDCALEGTSIEVPGSEIQPRLQEAAGDSSSAWLADAQVGDLDGVPRALLGPGPALAVLGVWGASVYLSVPLNLSNCLQQVNECGYPIRDFLLSLEPGAQLALTIHPPGHFFPVFLESCSHSEVESPIPKSDPNAHKTG